MPIQYDGKKIIPAPLAVIQKNYLRTGSACKVGSDYTITLTGRIFTCKGSPQTDGSFWTASGYPPDDTSIGCCDENLAVLLRKERAIRALFADDGKSFEIQPYDGSAPTKCYPVVDSITFEQGLWVDFVPYTIVLKAPELFTDKGPVDADKSEFFNDTDTGFSRYLLNADESWNVEEAEEREIVGDLGNGQTDIQPTYRVTHTVSAQGRLAWDSNGKTADPWVHARDWVLTHTANSQDAFGNLRYKRFTHQSSGLKSLPDNMQIVNHVRTEATNEKEGSYTLTETFLMASGTAFEDFTITSNTSNDDGKTRVSVEGSVIGASIRNVDNSWRTNVTSTRYYNAEQKWNSLIAGGDSANLIYTRANAYTGLTLNPEPVSTVVGRNSLGGTINYTYEYDDRASNCIPGSKSEVWTINDSNPTDIFASIGVMGRGDSGPVLQDMEATTSFKRAVTLEIVMGNSGNNPCPTTAAGVSGIMALAPKGITDTIRDAFKTDLQNQYDQVFVSGDTDSWVFQDRRYTRNFELTVGKC